MPRGKSGRVVLEIDPEFKRDLYFALETEGLTLKDWFLRTADGYVRERMQQSLFRAEQPQADYKGRAKSPSRGPGKRRKVP